jgi:hypothetical protein
VPEAIADFIIDFQSTDFESDAAIARKVFCQYVKSFNLGENSFVLDSPQRFSMGWSFTKMFLSLELVQLLYDSNSYEIENSAGPTLAYRFMSWLNGLMAKNGCNAQLKYANEMRDFGRHAAGHPIAFSDRKL